MPRDIDIVSEDSTRRAQIGIWVEIDPHEAWTGEGVSRLLGFIVEGVALSRCATFYIIVDAELRCVVEEDFRHLTAQEGIDWVVEAPSEPAPRRGIPTLPPPSSLALGEVAPDQFASAGEAPPTPAELERAVRLSFLARFANENVRVDGWLSLHPHFDYLLHLEGRRATLFPDANPTNFPSLNPVAWEPTGGTTRWIERTKRVVTAADRVITFSRHVAAELGQFGVPSDKVSAIPHAPFDLKPNLPFLSDRRGGEETKRRAGDVLRAHARERGWHYLDGFPFEEVPYVIVSTQDRNTKNLAVIAEAVRRLVRQDFRDIKIIMTASLHFDADWAMLPRIVERHQLHYDVLSLPRLPRDVHAALFHCALCSVHPSLFEGGVGSAPFFEGISVGTPCLQAHAPNTDVLLSHAPELAEFCFDPYNSRTLGDAISRMLNDRSHAVDVQSRVYERMQRRSWAQVAREYTAAVLSDGDAAESGQF